MKIYSFKYNIVFTIIQDCFRIEFSFSFKIDHYTYVIIYVSYIRFYYHHLSSYVLILLLNIYLRRIAYVIFICIYSRASFNLNMFEVIHIFCEVVFKQKRFHASFVILKFEFPALPAVCGNYVLLNFIAYHHI